MTALVECKISVPERDGTGTGTYLEGQKEGPPSSGDPDFSAPGPLSLPEHSGVGNILNAHAWDRESLMGPIDPRGDKNELCTPGPALRIRLFGDFRSGPLTYICTCNQCFGSGWIHI